MILGEDLHPQRQVYYIGSLILEILLNIPEDKIKYFDLFQKLNEKEKVSISLFTLTLDWLYILGSISNNEDNILRCF
jgi:hypothetical protein